MPLQKHSEADAHHQQSSPSNFNKYLLPQNQQVIDVDESKSNQSKKAIQQSPKVKEKKPIKSKSKRKVKDSQVEKQKQVLKSQQKKQKKTERKKSERKKKNQKESKNQQTPKNDVIQKEKVKQKEQDSAFKLIKNQYQQDQSISFKNKQRSSRVQDSSLEIDLLDKKKNKTKKQKEKQIKIKNKYFSDLNVQDKLQTDKLESQSFMEEKLELEIANKTSNNYHIFQKFDKKIDFIKGRMEFKNQDNDLKYKKQLKQKLNQVDGAEQVQISIEVPNVFMNKSVSGALYMKNIHQSQQREQTAAGKLQRKSSKAEQDHHSNSRFQVPKNKNKKVNRTDFFSQLNKQIKCKKQTSLSSQQIKQCFKTSVLDEKDNIEGEQYGNKDLTRRTMPIKSPIGQDSYSIRSQRSNQSSRSRNSSVSRTSISKQTQLKKDNSVFKSLKQQASIMIKEEIQSDISSSMPMAQMKTVPHIRVQDKVETKPQMIKSLIKTKSLSLEDEENEAMDISKKLSNIAQKIKNKKQIEKRTEERIKQKKKQIKQKQKQNKNQSKSTKSKYNDYFEDEAEVSGEDMEQSQEQQQIDGVNLSGDLIDLIDNSSYLLEKNEHLVRKKYLQDERLQDQILINRIKNGMFRKVRAEQTQSQKRLKRRMYQAAKRHQKQDLDDTEVQDDINYIGKQIKIQSENQSQSKDHSNQIKKLQQELLGQDIINKKKEEEQQMKSMNQTNNKKTIEDPWKYLNYVMPIVNKQTNKVFEKKQIKITGQKPQKQKTDSQLQGRTTGDRKSLQKKGIRQRVGNLNKVQKKKEIQLDFRNKDVSISEGDLINQLDI